MLCCLYKFERIKGFGEKYIIKFVKLRFIIFKEL